MHVSGVKKNGAARLDPWEAFVQFLPKLKEYVEQFKHPIHNVRKNRSTWRKAFSIIFSKEKKNVKIHSDKNPIFKLQLNSTNYKNSIPPKLEITFNFIWEFSLKLNRTKKKVTKTLISPSIFKGKSL